MSTVTHTIGWKDVLKLTSPFVLVVGLALGAFYKIMDVSLQGYETALNGQGSSITRLDERMGEQSNLVQARFNDMDRRFTLLTEDVAKAEQRLQDQIDGLENQNKAILAQLEGVAKGLQGLTGEFRDLREEIGPASYKPQTSPGIEFQTAPKRQAIPKPIRPSPQRDLTIPMVNLDTDDSPRVAAPDNRDSLIATYTSPVAIHHSGSLRRRGKDVAALDMAMLNIDRVSVKSDRRNRQRPTSGFNYVRHPAFVVRLGRLVPQGSTVTISYHDGRKVVSQSFSGNADNDASELAEFIGVPTARIFPGIERTFDCTGLEDTVTLLSLARELHALCNSDEEQAFDFSLLITDHVRGMFGVETFDDPNVGPLESSLRPKPRPAVLTP